MTTNTRKIIALVAMLGTLAAAPTLADNDKANNDKAKPDKRAHTAYNDASANHGQVVSDCNHRANDRELKGIDRQDYVEWCTSRGYRYDNSYRDGYWTNDRGCYGKANDRGLTGDNRADFLRSCLARDDERRYLPRL
jgi:hypothetical protein